MNILWQLWSALTHHPEPLQRPPKPGAHPHLPMDLGPSSLRQEEVRRNRKEEEGKEPLYFFEPQFATCKTEKIITVTGRCDYQTR